MTAITIYPLVDGVYAGTPIIIDSGDGIPPDAILLPPPDDVPPDKRVVWAGAGWVLDDHPAVTPISTLAADAPLPQRAAALTQREFRALWRFDERVQLDHPDIVEGLTALQRAQLGTLMRDLSAAIEIHLDHPDVVAGVGLVQALGIIDADRAAAILAGRLPA